MKYIDADKLIAEIERRIIEHKKSIKKDITLISEAMLKGSLGAYESIESFITSLQQEQPEVDLEKEVDEWRDKNFDKHQDFILSGVNVTRKSQIELARHFYELGPNARKEE